MGRSRTLSLWVPVVAWAAVIFALSAIPSLSSGLGDWDYVLRKCAHMTEYAVLGALLLRALERELPTFLAALAYAASDEFHQHFVRGRHASPIDVLIDAVGITAGLLVWNRLERGGARSSSADPSRSAEFSCFNPDGRAGEASASSSVGVASDALAAPRENAVAIELRALGDTEPLWRDWLEDAGRRFRVDVDDLEAQLPNWRPLLQRFAEERAPVYLRPDADVAAALRRLHAAGRRLCVFTEAPAELARVALAHLGASRRVDVVVAGERALERLRAELGEEATIVHTREQLLGLR